MTKQSATSPKSHQELARLREDLMAFYQPVNSQERLAVERIALAQQSILRAARLEASLFGVAQGRELHSVLETEGFAMFLRYHAQAEQIYRRAVEAFLAMKAQRPRGPAPEPAGPTRGLHLVKPSGRRSSRRLPAVRRPVTVATVSLAA